MKPDRERELLAANNAYLDRARKAEAALKRVEAERDRAVRNADMYQGQCDRQAVRMALLHLHLNEMLVTFRPFTFKPVGAPLSPARLDQENQRKVHADASAVLRDEGFAATIRDRQALDEHEREMLGGRAP